jgi:hypothetical protein
MSIFNAGPQIDTFTEYAIAISKLTEYKKAIKQKYPSIQAILKSAILIFSVHKNYLNGDSSQ